MREEKDNTTLFNEPIVSSRTRYNGKIALK